MLHRHAYGVEPGPQDEHRDQRARYDRKSV